MQKKISPIGNLFADEEKISQPNKKISVTFAQYTRTESVEPDEFFQGFNELCAVTYSLGLNQVERVMKFFESGAVIIGSHEQITADFVEMLALQKFAVDHVSKNPLLQKKFVSKILSSM